MSENRSNWVRFGEVPNLEPDTDEILEKLERTAGFLTAREPESIQEEEARLTRAFIARREKEAKKAAKVAREAANKAAITEENRRLWNEYHNIEASK